MIIAFLIAASTHRLLLKIIREIKSNSKLAKSLVLGNLVKTILKNFP